MRRSQSKHRIKQLEKKLLDKEEELKIIYQVAQSAHSLELDKLLTEIVEIASGLTQADSCLIYTLDPRKSQLILRASKNPHPTLIKKIKMRLGEGITGWVAREKKPVAITDNAANDSRFKLFTSLPEDRYQAFLSVPIVNNYGVVGVINIQHKESHRYSDDEINLLSAVGKIVGGAVENARLVEESLHLKEALETRKILEKAKGILIKSGLSEREAHRRLQQQSMNSRRSLREVSEAIIVAEKLRHK